MDMHLILSNTQIVQRLLYRQKYSLLVKESIKDFEKQDPSHPQILF